MNSFFVFLVIMTVSSCSSIIGHNPKVQQTLFVHNDGSDSRKDFYHWIRDIEWTTSRDSNKSFEQMVPEVQNFITTEQQFYQLHSNKIKKESEVIFQEMKSRLPKKDSTVPYLSNGHWYYSRYEEGSEHPLICRKKGHMNAKEEIMLDANLLAKDKKVFKLGAIRVSPDNKMLAYGIDTEGNRLYTLYFKNLESNQVMDRVLKDVSADLQWASDSKHFFMSKINLKNMRAEEIERYNIETLKPESIIKENDLEFDYILSLSKSKKYIFIESRAKDSTEIYFLPRSQPFEKPRLFKKREKDHLYFLDHFKNTFYVLSNQKNPNFDFNYVAEKSYKTKNWKKLIELDPQNYIEDFILFDNWIVLEKRHDGVKNFLITDSLGKKSYELQHPDSGFVVSAINNVEPHLNYLRFSYQTPVMPQQVVDWNLADKARTIQKTQEIKGDFQSEHYMSERSSVLSRDGKTIPITLVKRKDVAYGPNTPLLLYAYGSYGNNVEPYFRNSLISLLDRGFIFAIAHIRGSSFLGRHWYLDGKILNKKNTFYDFIDVAQYLIDNKVTSSSKLFARGASAGGLLMGAVANERPDLFRAIIAEVPFVDVLTTMLDEDLPLTTEEYQEWGNPNIKKYYDYIKSYSPYDNIKQQAYPIIFATGSIHDTQVGYWEPAKWVAKLREFQSNKDNPVILKIETETGHSGQSGRYKSLIDEAEVFAFLNEWVQTH